MTIWYTKLQAIIVCSIDKEQIQGPMLEKSDICIILATQRREMNGKVIGRMIGRKG